MRFQRFIISISLSHSGPVTYQLSAEVTDPSKANQSFPLVAVMKNYYAKTWYLGEPASLAGREVTIEPRQTN